MKNFVPTRRNNPCQLCGDTKGKCRETDSVLLCMTFADAHEHIPGFRFIGQTKDNLWGKWVTDDQINWTEQEREQWRHEQQTKRQHRQAEENQRRAAALSPDDRNRHYQQLLAQLTLHPDDHCDLHQRGLTNEQIQTWGVKSVTAWQRLSREIPTLPGVNLDGLSLNTSQAGYLCPIVDVDGFLVGFQIRSRSANSDGRYRWLTSRTRKRLNGPTPHLPNGELPLAIHRPAQNTRAAIGLCEGVGVKPLLTAQRRTQIVIGAAGGQFASSPQTLKTTLDRLSSELSTQTIEFYVDAGAVSNRHVLRQYRKTWKLLQTWGYTTLIQWWGQVSKTDPDVDELIDLSTVQSITVEEFEVIVRQANHTLHRILKLIRTPSSQKRRQLPNNTGTSQHPANQRVVEYVTGDHLQTWQDGVQQGYQYILDLSATGEGKSFSAGQAEPEQFGVRQIMYLSDQHRNPSVETLSIENGWIDLEARHNGLVRENTVDGSSRLKRSNKRETHAVPPNCNRTQLLSILRSKNITGADTATFICSTCPLKGACQSTEGSGYGYLYQRRTALSSPKLRAHPDSLADPVDYSYGDVALIWEEVGHNFHAAHSIRVSKSDLDSLVGRLLPYPDLFPSIQPLLCSLLRLFEGEAKTRKFGLSHAELVSFLPQLPPLNLEAITQVLQADLSFLNTTAEYGVDLADLPRTLQKQFLEKDSTKAEEAEQQVLKQWFVELLKVLQGELPGSSLYFHHQHLSIVLPSQRHRTIAQSAKVNVFLDATLTCEDLALKLGCTSEEIFVCQQQRSPIVNLNVIQVIDMGHMGMQRGANQEKRLDALVKHYQAIDATTKVIDFKKFKADGAHWRDSRGVNYFLETKTLITVGAPCPNLHEMLAQYSSLIGQVVTRDELCFQTWLNRQVQAEIVQEIGRLRANRRLGENLQVILVTDFPVAFPVQAIKASDITLDAATKQERVVLAIKTAIGWLKEKQQKITQTSVAETTKALGLNEGKGYSQQHVGRFWNLLISLIETSNSKMSKSGSNETVSVEAELVEAIGQVVEAIADRSDLAEIPETLSEIFFDWLSLPQRSLVWQNISPVHQHAILSSLLTTLPSEMLDLLETTTQEVLV